MNNATTVLTPRPVDGSAAEDYLSVPVPQRRELLYREVYGHLGWSVDAVVERSADTATLRLWRSAVPASPAVIDTLQHQAEQALSSVDALDRSVGTWGARARCLTHGIGGVYSLLGIVALIAGMAPLSVAILTVLSLAHTLSAGLVATRTRRMRAGKVDPLIAAQLDIVEEAVRRARTVRAGGTAEPRVSLTDRTPAQKTLHDRGASLPTVRR